MRDVPILGQQILPDPTTTTVQEAIEELFNRTAILAMTLAELTQLLVDKGVITLEDEEDDASPEA